jgi:hypothetical protein
MAKRKQSEFDAVASVPWPVGLVLGLIAYIAMRYGIKQRGQRYLLSLRNQIGVDRS